MITVICKSRIVEMQTFAVIDEIGYEKNNIPIFIELFGIRSKYR